MLLRLRMVEETENDPAETWKWRSWGCFPNTQGGQDLRIICRPMVVRSVFIRDRLDQAPPLIHVVFSAKLIEPWRDFNFASIAAFRFQLGGDNGAGSDLGEQVFENIVCILELSLSLGCQENNKDVFTAFTGLRGTHHTHVED